MNLVFEYIHYRWKAINNSRISSETENRIKNCISQSKTKLAFETELNEYRRLAIKDKRTISVDDFGAGSKKMGAERRISSIYKNSRSAKRFQRIMYNLIREFDCSNVLEMGTSLGFTSVFLSKAVKDGQIATIEACKNTSQEASKLFYNLKLSNIDLIQSTFLSYFENSSTDQFDFVFVDGHHDGTALLEYIDFLMPRIQTTCIFVLDDIRWSDSMLIAWKNLTRRADFPINIDLFRMGILVFERPK